MSQGQGSISFSGGVSGAVPPFVNVEGARNGVSLDADSFVVLGQNVGASGSPAALLSNREIPMGAFVIDLTSASGEGVSLAVGNDGNNEAMSFTGVDSSKGAVLSIGSNTVPGSNIFTLVQWVMNEPEILGYFGYNGSVDGCVLFSGGFPGISGRNLYITASIGNVPDPAQIGITVEVSCGNNSLFVGAAGADGQSLVGVGMDSPSARLHLDAGAAAASSAPLKMTSGTLQTVPEAGAIEYDGVHLYFTDDTGTRHTITAI